MSDSFPGIEIGQLTITYFSLSIVVALGVGTFITYVRVRNEVGSTALLLNLALAALMCSVLFARLFYILLPPPSVAQYYDTGWYLSHPFELQAGPFAIWSGGLAFSGAVVGLMVAFIIVLRRQQGVFWYWVDRVTPGLLAGATIVPWGNIVNGHNYGPPTAVPWGMFVESPAAPFQANSIFHPTPAYVSILALLTLGIIVVFRERISDVIGVGGQFLAALIIYFSGIFALEFLRVDVSGVLLGISDIQIIAAVYVAIAASYVYHFTKKAKL